MSNYVTGVDSAVMVKAGTVNEAVVKGLSKLGLPDYVRETIKASEFRTPVDVEFTTTASYGRITFGGNMVVGDTKGQDILKDYWKNNTKVTDIRFYLNMDDFLTCDLANDANAGFQVVKLGGMNSEKNGLYKYEGEMTVAGQIATFTAHLVDDNTPTITFVSGTPATITSSGNEFVTSGFKAGMTLIIEDSAANNKQVLIASVAAGTITLATGHTLVSGAPLAGVTLHGGTF